MQLVYPFSRLRSRRARRTLANLVINVRIAVQHPLHVGQQVTIVYTSVHFRLSIRVPLSTFFSTVWKTPIL
jgi:hypothetical protein